MGALCCRRHAEAAADAADAVSEAPVGAAPSVQPPRPGTKSLSELQLVDALDGDDVVAARGVNIELRRRGSPYAR